MKTKSKNIFFSIILITLPFLFFIYPLLIPILIPELKIYPGYENLIFEAYTDEEFSSGNSVITSFEIREEAIKTGYILKESKIPPYIGIYFTFKDSSFLLDLGDFDSVRVKIQSNKLKSLIFQLDSFVKGFTKKENTETFLISQHNIPISLKSDYYILYFDNFRTPRWWYEMNSISEQKLMEENISNFKFICTDLNIDTPDTIIISEIVFQKTNTKELGIAGVITLIYYIIIGLYILYKNKIKKIKAEIMKIIEPDEYLNCKQYVDIKAKKIIIYLGENYNDPYLDLGKLSNKTFIKSSEIMKIIKHYFNLSFSQYLNSIKLNEAKRLLKTTDRFSSEIAYSIGYKDPAYFNRIFKKIIGISPGQYRNKNKILKN